MGLYDAINRTMRPAPTLGADCWKLDVEDVQAGRQIAQSGILVFECPGGGYLYRGQSIPTVCKGDSPDMLVDTLLFDFPQIPGTRNGAPIGNGFELWVEFGQLERPPPPDLLIWIDVYNAWGDWKQVELYTSAEISSLWPSNGVVFAQILKISGQTADRWTVKIRPNQDLQATAYFSAGWTPGSEIPQISYGPQMVNVGARPGSLTPTK